MHAIHRLLLLTLLPFACAGQTPDTRELAERGLQTAQRLQGQMASWTATITMGPDSRIIAETFGVAQKRHIEIFFELKSARHHAATVVIADKQWYVKENDGIHGRYRPYEAPFHLAPIPAVIERTEPSFVFEADLGPAVHVRTVDHVATYRSPLPEEHAARLRNMMGMIEKMGIGDELSAEAAGKLQEAKQMLAKGIESEIDTESGMLRTTGTPQFLTEFSPLTWHGRIKERLFRIPDSGEDRTDDPTVTDRNELVMISNLASWIPAMGKGGDPDGRLLDLKRGTLRRIPFPGLSVMGGCFLKGRKEVAVTGMPAEGGQLGLYIINLSTGAVRELSSELLGTGMFFDPCLSPDGRTIAVKFLKNMDFTSPSPVVLFDIETGKARILGEVTGGQNLAWFPDGSRLLMLREEFPDPKGYSVHTICTMDMQGKVADIRKGDRAVLLRDGRILFTHDHERVWYTCNTEGKDEHLFFDGMKDYGFATRSPDGTRLLMMKFNKATGPRPTIVDLKDGTTKPATTLGGLWAWAKWL